MRELVLQRLDMLLADTSGNAKCYLIERTQDMIDHPQSKKSLRCAARRPESNERFPIKNRDCWYQGFDYRQLDDEDLILFFEYLCLRHWKQR